MLVYAVGPAAAPTPVRSVSAAPKIVRPERRNDLSKSAPNSGADEARDDYASFATEPSSSPEARSSSAAQAVLSSIGLGG